MSKQATTSGHVKTGSYPQGFAVYPGMVLADAHEACVAAPAWFTSVTGSKQAITSGVVRTASFPLGFAFSLGQVLPGAHEAPAAAPACFVTL